MHKYRVAMSLSCVSLFALVHSLSAEMVMYQGFPMSPKTSDRFYGFRKDSTSYCFLEPYGAGSYLARDVDPGYLTLTNPACFAQQASIPEVTSAGNGSLRMSYVSASAGASGSKVLTLTDNCAARTGSLYFRFLFRPDENAIPAMSVPKASVPLQEKTYACGLVWAVDDYTLACKTNTSLRLTQGLAISSQHCDLSGGTAVVGFERGFLVFLQKQSDGSAALKLGVWGKGASDYLTGSQQLTLAENVVGGQTYVCLVRIDIDHYAAGDDRIVGLAQPVETYDPTKAWSGTPFPKVIRADLIGTELAPTLCHLLVQGAEIQTSDIRLDEICLATTLNEVAVHKPTVKDIGQVIAYEGFPTGTDRYPEAGAQIGGMTHFECDSVFGFKSKWEMCESKSSFTLLASPAGLAFPACYGSVDISATSDGAVGPKAASDQGMYMRRPLKDNLLALATGEKLFLRVLIKATADAVNKLTKGPDTEGALITGTAGVQGHVNYFGSGMADCSENIEVSDSHAPTLCQRPSSCFFTITKNSDGTVGVYLNLLTAKNGTPAAYKILDVTAAGGTFLCCAQIEVGAGTDGKERIRAFACDVSTVTGKVIETWIPSSPEAPAIEHEIIDAKGAYPKHLMIGGDVRIGFSSDELGLSLDDAYPLVWARYPPLGMLLLVK